MKRKGLYILIALALGGAGAVHAQDNTAAGSSTVPTTTPTYDDRWYIAPTVGGYYNDTDRNTNSRQFYYGIGFGRFFSPNFSLDFFGDRTKRTVDASAGGGRWANNTYGVAARYYFLDWTAWRPYLLGGVMGSQHINNFDHGFDPAAEVGVGVSKTITDSSDFRVEGGYRYDWDDKTQPNKNGYGDWFLGFSIVSRIGAPPAPPAPPPPPPAPDCSKQFRNGVNLCDNKCPDLPEGTIVGPDGCPQKVVIDLRGVNFKFDRPKKGEKDIAKSLAEPTKDSLAVLDQAVDTLQRYPNVHVTVAGYTDSVGKDAYNQSLSERRAKIVYDYLTTHGIDASRLEGPIGHGKNDPIDTNDTDAGRARNRRTELQVQQ
ncbi:MULTISPECIES: OmpA family protein [Dyella]|uniref:OmpA family protein n=1 Tax=Dyella TaxID=231454 RepID=UPI000C84F316|nr:MULTISPECIES: OmpA family protein [Dyella]MDR3446309.1 OmpA family protein [Dyella sp.]PMQ02764.1 Outer membrane porin F [Dyella sp. AD56]ULU24407.1 OmpA family protein [Dyella terrae]